MTRRSTPRGDPVNLVLIQVIMALVAALAVLAAALARSVK